MIIESVLDKNLVHVNIHATNKEEILHILASKLLESNYITSADDFLEDVYKREAAGVTGIGNFVAIPHGKSAFVNKVGAAIAILDEEIEWETLDDQGVKIVILFAVGDTNDGAQAHLKMLASFARRLANDQAVQDLLAAKSKEEIIHILNQ